MKTAINGAAIVGAAALVVTYLLERSACLGIPDWSLPVLTTVQLALMWLAKGPLQYPPAPFGGK